MATQLVRGGELVKRPVFVVLVNSIGADQGCIDAGAIYFDGEVCTRPIVIYNDESMPLEFSVRRNALIIKC